MRDSPPPHVEMVCEGASESPQSSACQTSETVGECCLAVLDWGQFASVALAMSRDASDGSDVGRGASGMEGMEVDKSLQCMGQQ